MINFAVISTFISTILRTLSIKFKSIAKDMYVNKFVDSASSVVCDLVKKNITSNFNPHLVYHSSDFVPNWTSIANNVNSHFMYQTSYWVHPA